MRPEAKENPDVGFYDALTSHNSPMITLNAVKWSC